MDEKVNVEDKKKEKRNKSEGKGGEKDRGMEGEKK